uniref:adenylate cyclase type 1-like n=1 Tax=Myxine glutinosa TaxID=7769 RepID=UPI00358F3BDC
MEEPEHSQHVKCRRRRFPCLPSGRRADSLACEEEFSCRELETLFQSYNLKLEQTGALKALVVFILASASVSAVELGSPPSALTIAKGSNPVHCVVFTSLFIVTNVKYLQVTQLQQIVNLSLLFSFTFSFLCCPFPFALDGHAELPSAPEQGVWQLLLVTFVVYTLLPVRTPLALLVGVLLALSHLIITATSVPAHAVEVEMKEEDVEMKEEETEMKEEETEVKEEETEMKEEETEMKEEETEMKEEETEMKEEETEMKEEETEMKEEETDEGGGD